MITVPEDVLSAIDRLNGHARAYGCGKKAIYAYKSHAALILARAGELTARPVQVRAKCLSCGGDGKWTDFYDGSKGYGPCRRCSGTGSVTLRFIETTAGRHRWHHPWQFRGYEILRAAWKVVTSRYEDRGPEILVTEGGAERLLTWEFADGWAPNQKSEQLETDTAAELLNLVEAWVYSSPAASEARAGALHEMRGYRLRLQRDVDTHCWNCGVELGDDDYGHGGSGPLAKIFDFARLTCSRCRAINPPVWPMEPAPKMLTPAVIAWRDAPWRKMAEAA